MRLLFFPMFFLLFSFELYSEQPETIIKNGCYELLDPNPTNMKKICISEEYITNDATGDYKFTISYKNGEVSVLDMKGLFGQAKCNCFPIRDTVIKKNNKQVKLNDIIGFVFRETDFQSSTMDNYYFGTMDVLYKKKDCDINDEKTYLRYRDDSTVIERSDGIKIKIIK